VTIVGSPLCSSIVVPAPPVILKGGSPTGFPTSTVSVSFPEFLRVKWRVSGATLLERFILGNRRLVGLTPKRRNSFGWSSGMTCCAPASEKIQDPRTARTTAKVFQRLYSKRIQSSANAFRICFKLRTEPSAVFTQVASSRSRFLTTECWVEC
jgi:hypothetical protein